MMNYHRHRLMQSSKSSKARATGTDATISCCFRMAAIAFAGTVFAFLINVQDFTELFATFLSVSGLLRGTAAAIASDEFWAGELNRWDEAAFLICLSVIVYWAGS